MSDHKITIVTIKNIRAHPNPEVDRMEITDINGWQCIIPKGQFSLGQKAIYIEPDYLVPTDRPEFEFLRQEGKSQCRITVRKFKQVYSQGLVIPIPNDLKDLPEGTDVMKELGIERYETPVEKSTYGNFVKAPSTIFTPKFDVESYQRYSGMFKEDEDVIFTEKLHGASARYVFAKDESGEYKQFVGSRNNWFEEDKKNIWWMAFRQNPAIGQWCQNNPDHILYGEVFGQVQNLKYGAKCNQIFFNVFAIMYNAQWLNHNMAFGLIDGFTFNEQKLEWVPILYQGKFNEQLAKDLAEKDSSIVGANHMREGVVITPMIEQCNELIGRKILKIVSNRYLEKSK